MSATGARLLAVGSVLAAVLLAVLGGACGGSSTSSTSPLPSASGKVVLTLVGEKGEKRFTMNQLEALPSYTGYGGIKSSTGVITLPSKFTGVMGCTWMYLYPYLTGELNYWPANLSAGMKLLKVFPEGMLVLSIPYDLLPTILKNLQDMPWVLPIHQGGEEFRLRLKRELGMIQ